MQIIIRRIPQEEQRYETLGDWFVDPDGTIQIKSTDDDEDVAFLIALHELCEYWLCKHHGVTVEAVDKFDFEWTKNHPEYPCVEGCVEPGESPLAPYHEEHRHAMLIEHLMANFLGMTDYGVIR